MLFYLFGFFSLNDTDGSETVFCRMRKFDMPCPSVVLLKKHVLLMSLIGGSMPAPQLKETRLSAADLQDAYEQTVQVI